MARCIVRTDYLDKLFSYLVTALIQTFLIGILPDRSRDDHCLRSLNCFVSSAAFCCGILFTDLLRQRIEWKSSNISPVRDVYFEQLPAEFSNAFWWAETTGKWGDKEEVLRSFGQHPKLVQASCRIVLPKLVCNIRSGQYHNRYHTISKYFDALVFTWFKELGMYIYWS